MSPKNELEHLKKGTAPAEEAPGLKRESGQKSERTVPGRYFTPPADIYETEKDLVLLVDMPGVDKEKVSVRLDDGELEIEGHVSAEGFDKMQVLFSEYNIGNYHRRFAVSNDIQKDAIEANMRDGVLSLRLPKTPKALPRKIAVN